MHLRHFLPDLHHPSILLLLQEMPHVLNQVLEVLENQSNVSVDGVASGYSLSLSPIVAVHIEAFLFISTFVLGVWGERNEEV